jgi:hypothetical protein
VSLSVIQSQLGHANLGTTSIISSASTSRRSSPPCTRYVTPADNGLIDANNRLRNRVIAAEKARQGAEAPKLESALGLPP